MSSPLMVAIATTPPVLSTLRKDQAPDNKELPALNHAKKIIENYLFAEGDDRTINEIIIDTFNKINAGDLKKYEEFSKVHTDRQEAIKDLSQLKNLLQTQVENSAVDLDGIFSVAKSSPMWADGIRNATVRQAMEYYRTEYPDLGLPMPPVTMGQLGNYSEVLSSVLTNVLAVASQKDMFDLQEHMQHMHAMLDLQSALLKALGDVTVVAIKGM